VQRRLIERTAELGEAAQMQIGADQGALMTMLVHLVGARMIVEVGTFTGYSALCMARALPADGRLIACDVNEQWTAIGRQAWEEAGVADRIELRLGAALDTLRAMPADEHVDLAFIDADKPSYRAYYEELITRLRPNGIILVDNTLWSGRVLDARTADDEYARVLAAFNDAVAVDERVDSTILPVGDGLTLIRKR
jgi:caffeoyl-CoA O-methyltransferase